MSSIVPPRPQTKRDPKFMRVSKPSIEPGRRLWRKGCLSLRCVIQVAHGKASTRKSQGPELRRRDDARGGVGAVGTEVNRDLSLGDAEQELAALIELAGIQVDAGKRRIRQDCQSAS